jgi:hypothetical protein
MTRADKVYSVIAAAMTLGALAVWTNPAIVKGKQTFRRMSALEGTKVSRIVVSAGKPGGVDTLELGGQTDRMVYVMSTGCPYCAAQREALRDLFAQVDASKIITLSMETSASTEGYWGDVRIAAPHQLVQIPGLAVRAVPLVLCVDKRGRIRHALLGLFATRLFGAVWNPAEQRCA